MDNQRNCERENLDRITKEKLLYPTSGYYGKINLDNLVFNANLQEFSHKVSYIVGLHTNGKLSSPEAYQRLSCLWQQLEQSEEHLNPE